MAYKSNLPEVKHDGNLETSWNIRHGYKKNKSKLYGFADP